MTDALIEAAQKAQALTPPTPMTMTATMTRPRLSALL
jgi:hypothetical protein